jgi:hypothetical protein
MQHSSSSSVLLWLVKNSLEIVVVKDVRQVTQAFWLLESNPPDY